MTGCRGLTMDDSDSVHALPTVFHRESVMSIKDVKDKLEIGLKPDAPYRETNLPDSELNDEDERERRARQRRDTATDEDARDDRPRKPGSSTDG